jgi:hypothetical protein
MCCFMLRICGAVVGAGMFVLMVFRRGMLIVVLRLCECVRGTMLVW